MAIDESGEWWRGDSFDDLADYIRQLTEDGYPADEVRQARCACNGEEFRLIADPDEGCAQRECIACGEAAFICDSEEIWEEADPTKVNCLCGNESFELAVGFSLREDRKEVRWITVGQRCPQCGILGSFVDWQIDYSPSEHLRQQV